MRNANIYLNTSRYEIYVHDVRTGNQVFSIGNSEVASAIEMGVILVDDTDTIEEYVMRNYWDVMHDYGLL